jgi:hypothetical protein
MRGNEKPWTTIRQYHRQSKAPAVIRHHIELVDGVESKAQGYDEGMIDTAHYAALRLGL